MKEHVRATFRVPLEAANFLTAQAERNFTSVNAEVVRSIRERMERAKTATGEKFGDRTPVAAQNETACQGGSITHG
jgi:hypothetical protein